jgi:hypothetical protein
MEQNRTKIAKEQMLKALEGSLGIVSRLQQEIKLLV